MIPFIAAAAPTLVVWIGRLLLGIAPSILGVLLTRLGVGVATYAGVSVVMDTVKTLIFSKFVGLPPLAMQLIGVLQLGTVINIMLSAVALKALMGGLRSDGMMKRFRLK